MASGHRVCYNVAVRLRLCCDGNPISTIGRFSKSIPINRSSGMAANSWPTDCMSWTFAGAVRFTLGSRGTQ